MPRLIDFNPSWIDHKGRCGLGLIMTAPEKPGNLEGWRLFVLFANPLDGLPAWPGDSRSLILQMFADEQERLGIIGCGDFKWTRTGNTFETLSLTPSINAHSAGHFTITNGGW